MINLKRLNERMSELQITKAQLIKNSGLTRVTIDKILSGGNINVDTLESLAKGLGVSVGFFFDDAIGAISQTQSGHNNNQAGRDINCTPDAKTHEELIRIQEEVKALKAIIEEKNARIAELTKMNDFLMSQR